MTTREVGIMTSGRKHEFMSATIAEEQLQLNRKMSRLAERNAKKVLKPGDRLRVTKCPGTKRWITFMGWDGHWIVSRSGISDYSPLCVDMLNGKAVDFTKENGRNET